MNKPEQEMLLLVLEKKQSASGKEFYTGFLGINSVYANEYQGKLFVKLQKWPKSDSKGTSADAIQDRINFVNAEKSKRQQVKAVSSAITEQSGFVTEEDIPF